MVVPGYGRFRIDVSHALGRSDDLGEWRGSPLTRRVTIATPEEPAPRANTHITHRAKTRRTRPPRAHPRISRKALGRHHRRRRPQRPRLRRLSRARRQACPRPRSARSVSAARAPSKSHSRACRMSPCAYLAGLLHPLVVEELVAPRTRLPLDPRRQRPLRPLPRRLQHPALGR